MSTTRATRHTRAPRARVYRALLDAESVQHMPTTFLVCIEWPDAAAPAALYADPEYQVHKQARCAGSETEWFNAPEFVE